MRWCLNPVFGVGRGDLGKEGGDERGVRLGETPKPAGGTPTLPGAGERETRDAKMLIGKGSQP